MTEKEPRSISANKVSFDIGEGRVLIRGMFIAEVLHEDGTRSLCRFSVGMEQASSWDEEALLAPTLRRIQRNTDSLWTEKEDD